MTAIQLHGPMGEDAPADAMLEFADEGVRAQAQLDRPELEALRDSIGDVLDKMEETA